MIGCDISFYQNGAKYWPIDFQQMAKAGAEFCVIRSSFGLWPDRQFIRNYSESNDVIRRGVYHYFRADQDAGKQAEYMLGMIEAARSGMPEEPCWLDLEYNPAIDGTAARPVLAKYAGQIHAFMRVCAEAGVRVAIYTSYSHVLSYLVRPNLLGLYDQWAALANYPIVLAQYSNDKRISLPAPIVPLPWVDWWGWQKSADGNGMGRRYGVHTPAIDLDVVR